MPRQSTSTPLEAGPARDGARRADVRRHFDELAGRPFPRRRLHRFYYRELYRIVRSHVPAGAHVLDVGCGNGDLLASLRPSLGVGVDLSARMVAEARRRHRNLHFACGDAQALPIGAAFDYVVASNVVGHLSDLWRFVRELRRVIHPGTKLVVTYYNFVWEPVFAVLERMGLRDHDPVQNWLAVPDLVNLLELGGLEADASGYRTPLPVGPALLTVPANRLFERLPGLRRAGVTSFVTAHPSARPRRVRVDASCSVVVPTRNERGNIETIYRRLPRLGTRTELIFVDGNSTDGTAAEIERLAPSRPDLEVRVLHQGRGRGKGDAVRKGFAAATGDILMILDADVTVDPEDLPKFYLALVEGHGRFINGSRLVYPMEGQAMRLANIAGNKFFGLVFTHLLGRRITDTLCGTKVLWAEDYHRIAANRRLLGDFDPFGDFDLLFGASALGLDIRELPVRYRERTYGSTNIQRWRHGLVLLRMAIFAARRLKHAREAHTAGTGPASRSAPATPSDQ